MFNSITGRLSEKRADTICIETGGVEWELSVPARSVDDFGRIGDEARAFAWLHHYEDGMRLYGFPTESDRARLPRAHEGRGHRPQAGAAHPLGHQARGAGRRPRRRGPGRAAEDPGRGTQARAEDDARPQGQARERAGEPARRGPRRAGEWADVVRALADMGFDRKAAEKAVAAAAKRAAAGAAGGAGAAGEREREVFRAALLDLSRGSLGVARTMDPAFEPEEDERELTLRPKLLSEFQGQAALKKNLEVFIRAARERGEALDHLFLMGPPGLGKTTLALVVANELGADFKPTSAPALDKPKDLAGILTTLKRALGLLHRRDPPAQARHRGDALHRDGGLRARLGDRAGARGEDGAHTRAALHPRRRDDQGGHGIGAPREPLRHIAALRLLRSRRARVHRPPLARPSSAWRWTRTPRRSSPPRAGARRASPTGSFAGCAISPRSKGEGRITRAIVRGGLERLEIDELGLERLDREILRAIIQKYAGGPVGAETLAITVGEGVDSLEDYYEPYLIQAGLVARTSRGRVATAAAYRHLDMETPSEDGRLLF